MPTYLKEKEPQISSKIFNFSSTLSGLDYHQFDNSPSQCECNTSSYIYQPYSHVITGARKVQFQVERSDYKYSPKYREPCLVNWDKNLSHLCEVVEQYALQWAKQEMVGHLGKK